MVFPDRDYDTSGLTESGGQWTFTHKAVGADMFRYTWNYGANWTDWKAYESSTNIDSSLLISKDHIWKGGHVIMQC